MAVDFAELGIKIDSSGVVTADQRLNKLNQTSATSASRAEEMAKRWDRAGRAMIGTGKMLALGVTAPLIALASAATSAFAAQEKAEFKLRAALQANGRAVDRLFNRYSKFAQEMQRISVIGDETALAMLQQAESLGLTGDAAERAVKNAIAMAAAFDMSAQSAIRYAAVLEEGDTTMLNRYLPALRAIEDQSERVAKAQDILGRAFDVARAEAETTGGSLAQMGNAIGDALESIGKIIAPVVVRVAQNIKGLAESFSDIDERTKNVIVTVGAIAAAIGPALIAFGLLAKSIGKLYIVLAGAKGAVVSMIALEKALGATTTAAAVQSGVIKTIGRAWASLLGPLGLGAAGLAFLAIKITEGMRNFLSFEERAYGLRDALDSTTQSVERFSDAHQRMLNQMHEVPKSINEIQQEIEKLETMSRRFGEDSVAGRGIRLRLEQLRKALSSFAEIEQSKETIDALTQVQNELAEIAASLQGPLAEAQLRFNRDTERMTEIMREAGMSAGEIDDALQPLRDRLDKVKSSISGLSNEAASFIERIEDIEDSVAGGAAPALRDFERNIKSASELVRDGIIDQEQYNRAIKAFVGLLADSIDESRPFIDVLHEVEFALLAGPRITQEYADAMMRLAGAMVEAATGIKLFSDESNNLQQQGAGLLANDLSRGLASAIIGDRNILSAVGGVFRAHVTDAIAGGFQDAINNGLFDDDGKFSSGLRDSIGLSVGAGLGAAIGGNTLSAQLGSSIGAVAGQAMGSKLLTSLGAFAGPIGAIVGGLLGGVLGGLFGDKPKDPRFDFGALNPLLARKRSIDAEIFRTAIGDVAFGSTGLSDDQISQIVRGLQDFDQALAIAIEHSGAGDAVRDALQNFTHISDEDGLSLDQMMQRRFDVALSVMDEFVQQVVKRAEKLEDQMQRLADAFVIRRELFFGRGLGIDSIAGGLPVGPVATNPIINPPGGGGGTPIDTNPGDFRLHAQGIQQFNAALQGTIEITEVSNDAFRAQLAIVDELGRENETLIDTFIRLRAVADTLDVGLALVGRQFDGSREELIRFGDELSRAFGDNLDALVGGLNRIFQTFFSDAERAEVATDQARERAQDLFDTLGIEGAFTIDGFRELWDELFLTMGPDAQALLIEAGVAIADLIDAETNLAKARGSIVDQSRIDDLITQMQSEIDALDLSPIELALRSVDDAADDLVDQLVSAGLSTDEAVAAVSDWVTAMRGAEIAANQARIGDIVANATMQVISTIAPMWAEFARLSQQAAQAMETLRGLGATREQLMIVERMHQIQLQAFASQLEASIKSLAERLFGVSQSIDSSAQSIGNSVGQSVNNIREQMIRGIEAIDAWLESSLLSNISPLVPQSRLNEAERQFNEAFAAALGGDLDALADLPSLADTFLSEAAGFFGTSTSDFDTIWRQVRDAMEQVAGLDVPDPVQETAANTSAIAASASSIQISAAEQAFLASQLVQQIALLSQLTEETPAEVGKRFDIPLGDLIEKLTGEHPGLVGEALEEHFNELVSGVQSEMEALLLIADVEGLQLDALWTINTTISGLADSLGATIAQIIPDFIISEGHDPIEQLPVMHRGGSVFSDGPHNLQAGEFVVPRDGQLVQSGMKESFDELRDEIADLRLLTEQANRDRREGFVGVVSSGQQTRETLRRSLDKRESSRRPLA